MLTINLLDDNLKKILKKQSLAKKANLYTSILAGISILTLAGVFFFSKYVDSKVSEAEQNLAEVQSQILSYDAIFESMAKISQRLVSVEQILDARIVAEEKIDLFIALVDSQLFRPTTVGFGDPSEPLYFEFSGNTPNLKTYIQADAYIKSISNEEPFKSVIVSNLNRLGTGQYAYSYKINYDEEKLKNE